MKNESGPHSMLGNAWQKYENKIVRDKSRSLEEPKINNNKQNFSDSPGCFCTGHSQSQKGSLFIEGLPFPSVSFNIKHNMIDHWSATYLARYVKLQHKRSAHNRICAMCPTSEFEIVFSHSSVCLASFQHCQGHLWKDLKKADTAQSKMASIGRRYAPSNWYDMMIWWGELAKQIFGQSWDFVPTRGAGGSDPIPIF